MNSKGFLTLYGKEIDMKNILTAKLTSKAQVTIPIAIRKKLKLKEGKNIIFLENDQGYILCNPSEISLNALKRIQDSFEGEAQNADIQSEEDVVRMIKEIRKE